MEIKEIEIFTFAYDKVLSFYGDSCETEREIVRICVKRDDNKNIVCVEEYISCDGIIFRLSGKPQTPSEEDLKTYLESFNHKYNAFCDYCCHLY